MGLLGLKCGSRLGQKSEKVKLQAKCLLARYWQRNFLCEFTENCSAVFVKSGGITLLTWYCQLYFFPWISCGYPLDGSVQDFDETTGGEYNSISLHFCKPWEHFFLLFQSIDVRASENLFDSQVFQLDLFNRGSKAKIVSPIYFFQNVFSCVFFCLSPLRPECSGIRKTASFLASHRRKKYKNLHPRSFTNGAKVWKMLKIANFWSEIASFYQLSEWNENIHYVL